MNNFIFWPKLNRDIFYYKINTYTIILNLTNKTIVQFMLFVHSIMLAPATMCLPTEYFRNKM